MHAGLTSRSSRLAPAGRRSRLSFNVRRHETSGLRGSTARRARESASLARALQNTAPVPSFHVAPDAFLTMSRRRDMRSPQEVAWAHHIHCENLRLVLAREGLHNTH